MNAKQQRDEEESEEEDEEEAAPVDMAQLEAVRQSFAAAEMSRSKAPKPQLTREERRQQKKTRVQKTDNQNGKDEDEEESDDDADLVNPNRVTKKVTIADLDKPRELTRKERYSNFLVNCELV